MADIIDRKEYLTAPLIRYVHTSTKKQIRKFDRWMNVEWCDDGISKQFPLATFGASYCCVIAVRGGKQYGLIHLMSRDDIYEMTPEFVNGFRAKNLQAVLVAGIRQSDLEIAAGDMDIIAKVFDPKKMIEKDVVIDPSNNCIFIHRYRQKTQIIPFK
ncbi:MAG: hypothetical protein CO148_09670 [Nitrospirae bacterium CG_4_9_14_3_um_filter_41_27]|nr:MAG: hypothetical protein COV93_07070 [Candidatus Woesearchaeota archaeon CG11_big_fil_rev_8_21_14_0_20_43_8]PIO05368.1 MAG: hypothetical protein COT47_05090 [Candidatus Woesearchaeota archaeon CG08_land_8_20_14_0_20_43_7]PJA78979.1 MAG: hypothetical protein CO148_09670 [Nitrospirae bacterium CG_4_9_14_3_um_filter_41_27]